MEWLHALFVYRSVRCCLVARSRSSRRRAAHAAPARSDRGRGVRAAPCRSSAVVRSLVATLEASNVIVHIDSSRSAAARHRRHDALRRPAAAAIATCASRSARSCRRTRRAAILAHELQHACEVADVGRRRCRRACGELFEQRGPSRRATTSKPARPRSTPRRATCGCDAAARAGRALQAEPVVKFDH